MSEEQEQLRLTSLEVSNVLRIKAAILRMGPDDVLVIEGNNEQGKSSALKCAEMMFAGGKVVPPEPLHGDAKKGHIIARVGGLVLTKKFRTGKSPQFSVTTDKGAKLAKPQAIMDAMLHRSTLDPVKFMEMKDDEQRAVLAGLAELDFTELDKQYDEVFEERKWAKKEVARLISGMTQTLFDPMGPESLVDVAELQTEGKRRRENNQAIEDAEKSRVLAKAKFDETHDRLRDIAREIADLQSKSAALLTTKDKQAEDMATLRAQAEKMERMDEQEIEKKITTADDLNNTFRTNERHNEIRGDANRAEGKLDRLNEKLDRLKETKEQARLAAKEKLPVEHLDITEDGITYKGSPLSQAGRSAQLKVSVAVAIALNQDSNIKLLLIDDAEKLDGPSTRQLLELAKEAGFQVIMTRVMPEAGASEGSVVIEDGEVKEVKRA